MNTTGCAPNIARDNFFTMNSMDHFGPCIVNIPLYICVLTLATLLLLSAAILRTRFILTRQSKNRRGGGSRDGSVCGLPILQTVTLFQSWASVVVSALILILPLTFGTDGNVIVILVGIELFLFGISSERWMSKLIRLGRRIAGPGHASSFKDGADIEESLTESQDDLVHMDSTLKIVVSSVRIMLIVQFIFMVILAGIALPTSRIFFQIGIGIQGYLVFASMCAIIYQYYRCEAVIKSSHEKVQAYRVGGSSQLKANRQLESIQRKFRMHQSILLAAGLPASIILITWVLDLPGMPISYGLLLYLMMVDALVNGAMIVTFVSSSLRLGRRKRIDNATNPTTGLRGNEQSPIVANTEMNSYIITVHNETMSPELPGDTVSVIPHDENIEERV